MYQITVKLINADSITGVTVVYIAVKYLFIDGILEQTKRFINQRDLSLNLPY